MSVNCTMQTLALMSHESNVIINSYFETVIMFERIWQLTAEPF